VHPDALHGVTDNHATGATDVRVTKINETPSSVTYNIPGISVVTENVTGAVTGLTDVCHDVISLEDSPAAGDSVIDKKGSDALYEAVVDDNNAKVKDRMFVKKEVKKKVSSDSSENISRSTGTPPAGNVSSEPGNAAVHGNGESDEPAVVLRLKAKPNIVVTEEAEEAKKQRVFIIER